MLTCDLLRQTSFFSGYRFLNKEQIICKEGFSLYLLKISYALYTEPDLSMVILQDISSCTSAATEFNSPLLTQVALVYLATILNTPYRLSSHGHPKISQWFTQKMPFGLQYLISFSTEHFFRCIFFYNTCRFVSKITLAASQQLVFTYTCIFVHKTAQINEKKLVEQTITVEPPACYYYRDSKLSPPDL